MSTEQNKELVRRMVEETWGDKVVVRQTWTGTHTGGGARWTAWP